MRIDPEQFYANLDDRAVEELRQEFSEALSHIMRADDLSLVRQMAVDLAHLADVMPWRVLPRMRGEVIELYNAAHARRRELEARGR